MELLKNNISELWVFGYGSILWKTGFVYKSKKVGKIDGYVRRFWQGNVTHRGTPNSVRIFQWIYCGFPGSVLVDSIFA